MKRTMMTGVFGFFITLIFTAVTWATPVPDTGQTKCYNNTVEISCPSPGQPFYGQDANYSINPPSYTKLDSGGNPLSDSATSWAVIKDNVTGLFWENKTDDGTIHDKFNIYSWYDSNSATNGGVAGTPSGNGTDTKAFIKALNDAHFGGYSDWRLPTIKELAYVVNDNTPYPGPTIDTGYFPNTYASWYWTSTTYANYPYNAWRMGFSLGYASGYDGSKGNKYYVRAVRGGFIAAGSFTDNGNGTVTDTSTGLMWQQNGSSITQTWEQALSYCENLSLGGYTDWRLPTIKELQSIVNDSRYNLAINTTYFPYTQLLPYWSSTTDAYNTYYSRFVSFSDGSDGSNVKSSLYNVRAVRGGQSPDQLLIFVSPASQNVTKDAGLTTFSVSNTGTGTMPWTAEVTSGGSWLSITSGLSGSNAGTIICSFTSNTSTSTRTASIRVTATGATGSPVDVAVIQAPKSSEVAVPVPDTGQTKCYNNTVEIPCPSPGQPFYGQNGNYSINPMSYTKLDGNGNALLDSATSWVMVRDNVTGLIWDVDSPPSSWYDSNPATNGGYAGTPSYGTTEDVIKALNNARFGGYTDWRIPTIKELSNIVNYNIPYRGPTIDTHYFPSYLDFESDYWSSTTYSCDTSNAWSVNFTDGGDYYNKKHSSAYARAVRGRQAVMLANSIIDSGSVDDGLPTKTATAAGAYIDNGDGTVTDTVTGLMWQQRADVTTMHWEQALSYCENLNIANLTDWRLPTIKELRSIVDYSQYDPSFNPTYFPNTQSNFYWSSTTDAYVTSCAWGLSSYDGISSRFNKVGAYYARAVRGGQSPTSSSCTATLNGSLLLHIPYLSYGNGTLSLWADLVCTFNPMYPTLIPFKLATYGIINNPSFSCAPSILSSDFTIHIPDVLFQDGITHIWVNLIYSPTLSTDGNAYFVVSNYGVVFN